MILKKKKRQKKHLFQMEKTWMFAIKYFEENIPVSLIYFIRQDKMLSGPYQNTSLQTAHPTEL